MNIGKLIKTTYRQEPAALRHLFEKGRRRETGLPAPSAHAVVDADGKLAPIPVYVALRNAESARPVGRSIPV